MLVFSNFHQCSCHAWCLAHMMCHMHLTAFLRYLCWCRHPASCGIQHSEALASHPHDACFGLSSVLQCAYLLRACYVRWAMVSCGIQHSEALASHPHDAVMVTMTYPVPQHILHPSTSCTQAVQHCQKHPRSLPLLQVLRAGGGGGVKLLASTMSTRCRCVARRQLGCT
jgi:hypothetical protein